ncbi:MAG: COR domain-containing protein [Xenococcus sp. (in: cyanobacteria)]
MCLHFQDNKNSLLYETIILKPEWATDAVYKVLDNKGVMNNQGCFNNSDLDKIWSEENYAGIQGRLLELMIKFQLCYEIPQQKDTFIAPQVLSDNQPEYDWNDSNNLILRYTYHDFMPKGIITRFIVIMHQYIDQQKYVWKTGVILIKDNAKAEVIEDYGKREIKIRVAGTNKRNFMTIVTHELDKINDSYQQLKYEKLVPCHCNACKNSQNPFAYDFNKLLERYAHSKLTIECGNPPYNEVQVLGLIDNAIDIKQLIPQDNQYGDKSIKFADHIQQFIFLSAEKGNITGNFSELIRNIKIGQGNYNEHIEGDYKDQRRAQNIMAKTIDVQSANAFDLGDISEEIAKTIKTLPDFDEPNKKELKLILIELHNTVLEETLDTEEKAEILKQIQTIAAALQNSQDTATKKTSQKAMKMLLGNAVLLPSDRSFVTICNQLPELIAKIFES